MQASENQLQQETLPGKPRWPRYVMLILASTLLSTLLSTYTTAVSTAAPLTGFWLKAAAPGFMLSCFWTLLRYSGWLLAGWIVAHRNALHLAAYQQEEQRRQARLYIPHIALLGPACLYAGDRQVLLRQQRAKPVPFCNLLAVPQCESAAPPYLAEPESISEADGQQDTDAAMWDAYAAGDEAVADDESSEEIGIPLADDAAVSDMTSGEEEQEQRLPAAQYLPAQLATMLAEWPRPVLNPSVPVSWSGSEDAWLRFRQHASELGIFLTAHPQRLHNPEDIDLVIDALHARQHASYHLLAGIVTPVASFGASHGPPAAEAAFAMLASNTPAGGSLSRPVLFSTPEHLALAQRNAALANPPASFFSLNRDSPEALSAAGWQIDAVEHEPYWGNPGALGCWIMAAMAVEAAMLRQQAVGWHAQQAHQHWAGMALPPESTTTGAST
ncbi:hypothetical protein DLM_3472 [Aquitalea magnusonii]|uniref:Transmembrane protein n=1 Tax=Aquitalea magnusonii TaxID=332411 RepID=A0A3G9GGS3_9NEIS|nr:hypothetical protein [Aquitalea magnusonii]BBF87060.1 hypothetical protein DLM_3472 [Aquitalea magnusonii]